MFVYIFIECFVFVCYFVSWIFVRFVNINPISTFTHPPSILQNAWISCPISLINVIKSALTTVQAFGYVRIRKVWSILGMMYYFYVDEIVVTFNYSH
jgi:hypothetical protein